MPRLRSGLRMRRSDFRNRVQCAAFSAAARPVSTAQLRNIAIIAHVDHGKTTLVDQLLKQSGTFDARKVVPDRVMDSNALERERGITILAKNTAIRWRDYRINIVDTPGHADFGGEVERVLSMVDSRAAAGRRGRRADAADALRDAEGVRARPAPDRRHQQDRSRRGAPAAGCSTRRSICSTSSARARRSSTSRSSTPRRCAASPATSRSSWPTDMTPLFEAIVKHCPPPDVDENGPLQLQVSQLDYSSYVGAIGIGRIKRGKIRRNSPVVVVDRDGKVRNERIMQVHGLPRPAIASRWTRRAPATSSRSPASSIPRSPTRSAIRRTPEALPALVVDEPTISMTFEVNTSPFCGREGKYVTSRQIRERLLREAMHNVALRVEETDDPDKFRVYGRGELHLGVLLENMRREGYELAVSRPRVVIKEIEGQPCEPYETLAVDLDESSQGAVMQALGERGGQLTGMHPDGKGRVRLDYVIPSRGLIGFQTEFRTHDVRHRHHASHLRSLRPGARPRDRPAPERRADLERAGQGARLCAVQPAGARQADGRRTATRSTKARSSASTAATTTWSSIRSRRRSSPTSAPPAATRTSSCRRRSATRWSRRWSSSPTTSWSR